MAEVSVIIPVYNAEEHLPQTIASVKAQTFADWELILVDDGSSDGSAEICDREAESDARIRVIHRENGGLIKATETGVMAADSPYIMFLDNDDRYEPDNIEVLYGLIREYDADCVNGTYKKYLPDGTYTEPVPLSFHIYEKEDIEREILTPFFEGEANIYRHWSTPRWDKIYRRDLVRRVCQERYQDLFYGEDLDFCLRYLFLCKRVITCEKRGYAYLAQPASMAHGYSQKMLESYEHLLQAVKQIAAENHRPYTAQYRFADQGYADMLYELEHTDMPKEEKKRIRRDLQSRMHTKFSLRRTILKKDFPGKSFLQKVYRKIRN